MGETTDQIEAHIEMTRQQLHSNFRELAQRVKAATDWRRQVRNHPMILIAASFAAGVLLAALVARTPWRSARMRAVQAPSSRARRRNTR
jgi:ElaB/YqjD/DUF883 family membrane-anchored ribosome-binding protein